jgi:hypothetical protein
LRRNPRVIAAIAAAAALIAASQAIAQSNPRYIQLPGASGTAKAALYLPNNPPAAHVGVIVMHRTSNYLSHLATRELSARGFAVLGVNPRSDNNDAAVSFELNTLDLKAAVVFMKAQPGITKVILFGHSGGGPASTFYQAVAENGVVFCQDPNRVVACPSSLAGLPGVDGVVLADAHPGIGINQLRSLNAAVRDNEDEQEVNEKLDPFNPDNGYNENGASTYSAKFRARYFKAQAERMNKLISKAQARLARVIAGKAELTDDEPFVVYRGDSARLMQLDPGIHHQTEQPRKVLLNNGTLSIQIAESVRPAQPELREANETFGNGVLFLTLRSFLSGRAVKSTDSMVGIDYCSSNNSTLCNLQHMSVPLLITAMGGHYFIRDSETHFEAAKSVDKDFIVIEGATHGLGRCTACETTPGQYSNATRNLFDYVAAWMKARY